MSTLPVPSGLMAALTAFIAMSSLVALRRSIAPVANSDLNFGVDDLRRLSGPSESETPSRDSVRDVVLEVMSEVSRNGSNLGGADTADDNEIEALVADIVDSSSAAEREPRSLRAKWRWVPKWMCRNKCYRDTGFWDSDCICDVHWGWYMWICKTHQGTPIKWQFCGEGTCHGCKAPSIEPPSPSPSPTPAPTPASPQPNPGLSPGSEGEACAAEWGTCHQSRCCASAGQQCFAKNPWFAQCRNDCSPGIHYDEPLQYHTPWSCKVLSSAPAPAPVPVPAPQPTPESGDKGYSPGKASLLEPSNAQPKTFYMYRVQSASNYPPENQNMGNLAGAIWYLHNEIVNNRYERRYHKTRVQRFKMVTKATQPLLDAGMNFGVRFAFDLGECTGPFDCQKAFNGFGYFVGCNNVSEFPTQQWAGTNHYDGAIWYSLPGKCSSSRFDDLATNCDAREPGGHCNSPTGAGNCTYSYEEAGDLSIDDIEGIRDFKEFVSKGGWEYNNQTDKGIHMNFWDDKFNNDACNNRVIKVAEAFDKKYPNLPKTGVMESPACDFDYRAFYAVVPQE